jgi:hypothetical protein
MTSEAVVILCAFYLESPKEYLLLASLPTALAGLKTILVAACFVPRLQVMFYHLQEDLPFGYLQSMPLLQISQHPITELFVMVCFI